MNLLLPPCLLALLAGSTLAQGTPQPALLVQETVLPTGTPAVSGDTIAALGGGDVTVWVDDGSGFGVQTVLSPASGSFGRVDIDGDVLVALGGGAHVFERSGSVWSQVATLPVPGGLSLSLCGDRFAVAGFGAVNVYARSGGTWSLEQSIVPPSVPNENEQVLGAAIADDRLLVRVGGIFYDVEVYRRTGSTWQYEADLPKSVGGFNDYGLALDLSVDGSVAVVGDPAFEHAFVYRRTGTSWAEEAELVNPEGDDTGDGFARGLALADGRLYVTASSAPLLPANGFQGGAGYVYDEDGGAWTLEGVFHPYPGQPSASFGPAIDADGDLVVSFHSWWDGQQNQRETDVFRVADAPATYCTAKTTTGGCVAKVDFVGRPSDLNPNPFVITARDVPNQKNGLFFYGTSGSTALPFLGGTLCVLPPLQRTPVQSSGGSAPPADDCSGGFAFDGNGWIQSGNDPGLVQGVRMHGQFWFRDPLDPIGAALSDAIELTILH